MEDSDHSLLQSPKPARRSFFGGNPTVRYGLVVVMMAMLFLKFYNSMYEAKFLRGPIDDFFRKKYDNMTVVYPTAGGAADAALEGYARRVAELLGQKLSADIPVQADSRVNRRTIKRKSLLLYGPLADNLVGRKLASGLPLSFRDGRLCRGDGSPIARDDWRLIFLAPNPENRSQYVLVYTAATPDLLVGINFAGSPNYLRHDTTDYVLAAGDSVLAAGFFDKDSSGVWTLPPGALSAVGR